MARAPEAGVGQRRTAGVADPSITTRTNQVCWESPTVARPDTSTCAAMPWSANHLANSGAIESSSATGYCRPVDIRAGAAVEAGQRAGRVENAVLVLRRQRFGERGLQFASARSVRMRGGPGSEHRGQRMQLG